MATPPVEVNLDATLVRSLLVEQHGDLAHLPLTQVGRGWDNSIFRLGQQFSIRLPHRQLAAQLIEQEQKWLPLIAPRLPLPVPVPYRIGKPTLGYPWYWSILPWLEGNTADKDKPTAGQSLIFAHFLRSLHTPTPTNAPKNPFRSVPLSEKAKTVQERMQRLKEKTNLISPQLESLWSQALNTPIDVEPRWIHGDLHPQNILVKDGVLTGIIDWGDMTSGDIATDLASFWMIFPQKKTRHQALAEYGNISEATRQRAKGWAMFFGIVLLDTGLENNPRQAILGEKILRCLNQIN